MSDSRRAPRKIEDWQTFLMEEAVETAEEQYSGETKFRHNGQVSVNDSETEYMYGRFGNRTASNNWTQFPM